MTDDVRGLLEAALAALGPEPRTGDRELPGTVLSRIAGGGWEIRVSQAATGIWNYYLTAPESFTMPKWLDGGWINGTSRGRSAVWQTGQARYTGLERRLDGHGHDAGPRRLQVDDPENSERGAYLAGLAELVRVLELMGGDR